METVTINELILKLERLQELGYGDTPVAFTDRIAMYPLNPTCTTAMLANIKQFSSNGNLFANTVQTWNEEMVILYSDVILNYNEIIHRKRIIDFRDTHGKLQAKED